MRRALFSVTDKTGLEALGKGLLGLFPELEILASGGTAKLLESANIPHAPISSATQFPECFGGRVKTLHPAIFGGILFRRGVDDQEAADLKIVPIDLVVCNLYLFDPKLSESMDIGGSAMIRAACKNYASVAVLVDPRDYEPVLKELSTQGTLSLERRRELAKKAMRMSAEYEARIADAFADEETPFRFEKERKLTYGENPDQEGWIYSLSKEGGIASAKVFGEKGLSYNNYEDASQAFFCSGSSLGKGLIRLKSREP